MTCVWTCLTHLASKQRYKKKSDCFEGSSLALRPSPSCFFGARSDHIWKRDLQFRLYTKSATPSSTIRQLFEILTEVLYEFEVTSCNYMLPFVELWGPNHEDKLRSKST